MSVQTFSLPPLPYAYNALEPQISSQIMTLHHDKHHQAYVTNLNAALSNYSAATAAKDIAAEIALQNAIRFNGGGHINHSLFWKNLAPANSSDASDPDKHAPKLLAEAKSVWGGLHNLTAAFSTALMGIQGSGWGWLVRETLPTGQKTLKIVTTGNQDPVVGAGEVPVLGVDMWEHAYYLQYQNGKQSYVDNIWKIINWTTAEQRFTGSRDDTFDTVKLSISFWNPREA